MPAPENPYLVQQIADPTVLARGEGNCSGGSRRVDPHPLSPAGIALSPNGKTLYLIAAGTMEVMAYPLEGVGIPGKGRLLCKLDRRSGAVAGAAGGLAVDGHGNLYTANPAIRAVQVLNSEVVKLGLIALPDPPLACAVGGPESKTLFVATRHALFKVQLDNAGPGLARKES